MSDASDFKTELLAAIPNLRAFAISLCGTADKADDLVQEALVRAWGKQDTFQPGSNLRAWLFTILRNEFYTQMRKRGREVSDADGALTNAMAAHPEQTGKLDFEDFKTALMKLPDDQREAIILVGASGLAYEEAAEICGCAVGTVKSRVSRARVRLSELLNITDSSEYGPDGVATHVLNRPAVGNAA